MIAATPIPTIPWTAWLILIPIQIVLDVAFIWAIWWTLMTHDPNRLTYRQRLAWVFGSMFLMAAFMFGTLFSTVLTLNPTHDPRIGMVGLYYLAAADMPPMLAACWILWRACGRWIWSPEAIKRNKGGRVGEYFFPADRPNISLREAAELAKQMDRAARGKPPKAATAPIDPPTDNSDADLEALERQMGVRPPPPEAGQHGGNKSGHR